MPEDAWRQFAHDPGNTGYNPVATGPANRMRLGNAEMAAPVPIPVQVTWRYASPVGSIWLPTIADDTLYAGDFNIQDPETSPGTVHAVNLLDGTEHWQVNVADGATGTTVVDDTVFVESWDTNVYALDAATGEERWRYDAPTAPPGEIHVYEDTVYIPSRDTTLYAVDVATGEERWRFDLKSPRLFLGLRTLHGPSRLGRHGDENFVSNTSLTVPTNPHHRMNIRKVRRCFCRWSGSNAMVEVGTDYGEGPAHGICGYFAPCVCLRMNRPAFPCDLRGSETALTCRRVTGMVVAPPS